MLRFKIIDPYINAPRIENKKTKNDDEKVKPDKKAGDEPDDKPIDEPGDGKGDEGLIHSRSIYLKKARDGEPVTLDDYTMTVPSKTGIKIDYHVNFQSTGKREHAPVFGWSGISEDDILQAHVPIYTDSAPLCSTIFQSTPPDQYVSPGVDIDTTLEKNLDLKLDGLYKEAYPIHISVYYYNSGEDSKVLEIKYNFDGKVQDVDMQIAGGWMFYKMFKTVDIKG